MGSSGLPSSFLARPMRITPACPLRKTSASPSITRAITPQPALHSGQILGFHVAMPATRSSSGMKRMIWFSGLPHAVSAALVPVIAVSLMKCRRSIRARVRRVRTVRRVPWLVMTCQAIVRCLPLLVAADAEIHVHVHGPARHRLLGLVAMTRRTFDLGANVRRMLEPHVRLGKIAVDAIPVEIHPLTLHVGDLLDQRPIGGDLRMAGHTSVEPGQTRARSLLDRGMAVGTD